MMTKVSCGARCVALTRRSEPLKHKEAMQAHHSADQVVFPFIAALVVGLTLGVLPTFVAQGALTIEALGDSAFNPGDKTISVASGVVNGRVCQVG